MTYKIVLEDKNENENIEFIDWLTLLHRILELWQILKLYKL